jgi:hypothetical protein
MNSCLTFAAEINFMEKVIIEEKHKDITNNWVVSSRFLFYVQLFCLVAFILGGCYKLYSYRYKGKPQVDIPSSTLYDPKYSK